MLQIGHNPAEGVVKLRVPAPKSDGGWIVQRMSASAARELANWFSDGAADKRLKVSDGKRWAEHEIPRDSALKFAEDLRRCADLLEETP
jgi:hypothetical protein